MEAETRYARSGEVSIAYQVTGNGPFDLVYVPPFVSHVELSWQVPGIAEFNRRLSAFSRLIRFDKRGQGMSDQVSGAPSLETRMDDVRAVMDAVGSERAALLGSSEGGPMSILFAATYPHRVWALVLCGSFARELQAPDYPFGTSEDDYRRIAERIPGARHIELPGADHAIFAGDPESYLREIERFLTEVWEERSWEDREPDRVLATVLFTDIVGSTARVAELGDAKWRDLLQQHHALIRRQLVRFRGSEIDTAGDGFFASFDGPARAIRCACAISDAVRELGLEVRAGLHTGECERIDAKVGGIAVSIGARVAAEAEGGEVLVSSTVRDLVAGSGISFRDRGVAELKGVPGEWRLYAVDAA